MGNSAAQFALQRLGFDVLAIPTIVLGHHKGHASAPFELMVSAGALSRLAADADDRTAANPYQAILSGYAASAGAVEAVAAHIGRVKSARPELIYLCDPVLGDHDRLYVDKDIAEAMRMSLVPQADILTPNLFELGWLTGAAIDSIDGAVRAARSLQAGRVLVTSAPPAAPDEMANLLVTPSKVICARSPRLETVPHGTGDLIAALFLARILEGRTDQQALSLASAAVHDVLKTSKHLRSDELALVAAQDRLSKPETRLICATRPE